MRSGSDLPTLNASLDVTSAVLLAAWTLPLPLYAAATGVVVYWILDQLSPSVPVSGQTLGG